MAKPQLPNIEQVFTLFQNFQSAQAMVMRTRTPGQWTAGMAEQRDIVKQQFEAIGLAQHIDWSDPA
jgi:hypothetical protein